MPVLLDYEERVMDQRTKSTIDGFIQSVAEARQSALLLDFDGTLAPFRIDPSKVQMWTGVQELLQKIQDAHCTRIAVVTGRPAKEAALLLQLRAPLEIWGVHGAERLYTDGRLEQDELLAAQQQTLTTARNLLKATRWKRGIRIEDKWNAVVLHWRGAAVRSAYAAQMRALHLLRPFAEHTGMELLQFDGGVELRAGRNKGAIVRLLLSELRADAPVAYLGDDTTDENAFKALAGRGLGVLVRRRWRPSAALVRLNPPTELLNFLAAWAFAVQK
jgi:trehalose 6-phosphate phosphatase